MSGDLKRLYWRFSTTISLALMLALIGYWVSAERLGGGAWRGVFYLTLLVATCFVVRLKIFKEKSVFFDIDHPPSSFGKKRVVVFGRSVRDVEIETQEKLILAQSGGQSSTALIYFLSFATGCGLAAYILTTHGLLSFFSFMTMAFLFFVQFYSPFLRQLGVLVFVAIFVGFWGLQSLDFEGRPEFLGLLFAIVALVVLASQYLRAMELSRLLQGSKKSAFRRREELGLLKNSIWIAGLFTISVWVAQAWIPHRSFDPDLMLPGPEPKLFSPKLNRSLAEKLADLTSGSRKQQSKTSGGAPGESAGGNAGGSESAGGGESGGGYGGSGGGAGTDAGTEADNKSDGDGGFSREVSDGGGSSQESQSGVPSPEPLPATTEQAAGASSSDRRESPSTTKREQAGGGAKGSDGSSGSGGTSGTSDAGDVSGSGSADQQTTGSTGQNAAGSAERHVEPAKSQPESDKNETPVDTEKRIQEWEDRLEEIFENFKSAFLIVLVVLVVVMLFLHFKPQKTESEETKKLKKHTLGASDRERLKLLFQLVKGRAKGDRQEVIETYNAVLEVFSAAHYPREDWNPVDEYSESIEQQIPTIGNDFQSLTATFSDVLYGEQEVERLELEKFRQDVSDILKYFRLS